MPILTMLRIAFAGVALPFAAADAVGKGCHFVEHRWTSGTTFSPSTRMTASRGARSATCSTARFSVMLIFSPRNMASMRAADRIRLPARTELEVSSVMRFFE